jgi:hypothetical protein
MQIMEHGWSLPNGQNDVVKKIGSKIKNLRRELRHRNDSRMNLAETIDNNKMVIQLMDTMEEFRDMSLEEWNLRFKKTEWNLRRIEKGNPEKLLQQQKEYWEQRSRIKCVTLGDENTKFFFMLMQPYMHITKNQLWL